MYKKIAKVVLVHVTIFVAIISAEIYFRAPWPYWLWGALGLSVSLTLLFFSTKKRR